ncbi:hypothetical protein T439DRAFT_75248 [Meredithblackwellia eburnea MCA 4105]
MQQPTPGRSYSVDQQFSSWSGVTATRRSPVLASIASSPTQQQGATQAPSASSRRTHQSSRSRHQISPKPVQKPQYQQPATWAPEGGVRSADPSAGGGSRGQATINAARKAAGGHSRSASSSKFGWDGKNGQQQQQHGSQHYSNPPSGRDPEHMQQDQRDDFQPPPPSKSLYHRRQSSVTGPMGHMPSRPQVMERAHSHGPPSRPARPSSPTLHPLPTVPPQHQQHQQPTQPLAIKPKMRRAHSSNSSISIASTKVPDPVAFDYHSPPSNNNRLPLDLGIELNPNPYPGGSTYRPAAAKSSPNLGGFSPRSEDLEFTHVEVATRVDRNSRQQSFARKQSVATIVQVPHRGSNDSNASGTAALPPLPPNDRLQRNGSTGSLTLPGHAGPVPVHIRPSRDPSPNGTVRPIGHGARASYSGSIPPPSNIGRRTSSMYLPNSSGSLPGTVMQPQQQLQGKRYAPTPAAVSRQMSIQQAPHVGLGLRTSHLAHIPGYGWRLALLEKLEVLLGFPLTSFEAEEILSIGNVPEPVAADKERKNRHRKSQIGIPPPSEKTKGPLKSPGKGFFGSVKRAFTSSETSIQNVGTSSPPKPPPSKTVFGTPLAVVAEYGFVTSMIAGQRHQLPGVCFSAVEETYRRGQGTKVPGLFHNAGEPSRIAKLVDIYNTGPEYGENHDLSIESIHNTTALLKKYLRDLPEPILDSRVWRLFLSACVDSTAPLRRRIGCCQILIRLLPMPNFSLLVYLVAFLSQIPLFPENALSLEATSVIFGPSIMSPRVLSAAAKLQKFVSGTSPSETHDIVGVTAKKAQDGLFWLLLNWSAVADGLLEPDFEIDTDEIMTSPIFTKPVPSVPAESLKEVLTSPNPSNYENSPAVPSLDSGLEVDVAPSWGVLAQEFNSTVQQQGETPEPQTPLSVYGDESPQVEQTPPAQHQRPPPPQRQLSDQDHYSSHEQGQEQAHHRYSEPLSPSVPTSVASTPRYSHNRTFSRDSRRSIPATPDVRPRSPQSAHQKEFRRQKVSLTDVEIEDSRPQSPQMGVPSHNSSSFHHDSDTPDMPTSESSRSSQSTIESSVSSRNGVGSRVAIPIRPLFKDVQEGKAQPLGVQNGFARPAPEDEFGPLGPSGTSVLDDLMDGPEGEIFDTTP